MQRVDAKRMALVSPADITKGDDVIIGGRGYVADCDAKKGQTLIVLDPVTTTTKRDETGIDMGAAVGASHDEPKVTTRETIKPSRRSRRIAKKG